MLRRPVRIFCACLAVRSIPNLEDGSMKPVMIGLALLGLAALTGPSAVSADESPWQVVQDISASPNVPTVEDDDSQSALLIAIGVDPSDAPLPSQLPALAGDEASAAVEALDVP